MEIDKEKEGILIQRIRNQLRIHWQWLRKEKDYNKVGDMINTWMRQALSKHKCINEKK